MIRDALVSDCGLYRYWLSRQWGDVPLLPFILLNPSVADAEVDDPTLRRGVGFAKRWGFGGLLFLNLFAYRATKPRNMMLAVDPVGPDNDAWLIATLQQARAARTPVVCGWGADGVVFRRSEQLSAMATAVNVPLSCLGKTTSGQPSHPLYLRADAELQSWP